MAGLSLEYEDRTKELITLLKNEFPNMNGRILALIGKRSRELLKKNYLSGQELDLRAFPVDKIGRKTIRSDVNRSRTQTKIYSYPANLFETGRKLRDGRNEPGKFIITRKLKSAVNSKLPVYVAEAEKKIINPIIKKVGL